MYILPLNNWINLNQEYHDGSESLTSDNWMKHCFYICRSELYMSILNKDIHSVNTTLYKGCKQVRWHDEGSSVIVSSNRFKPYDLAVTRLYSLGILRYPIQLWWLRYVSCSNQFESTLNSLQYVTRYHEFSSNRSYLLSCINTLLRYW